MERRYQMPIRCLRSWDTNPHRNLAREEAMLLAFPHEDAPALLYLWQNASTVVIGRNQNAWRECRTRLLEEEGGVLARRTTGGGAVYHDLGNLNFSFLLPRGMYALERQLSVVREAVRTFGVDCEFSGRNDLLAGGKKFSGNAFRFTKEGALHHGTLLVAVDPDAMSRYLSVSKDKLAARGVQSVPSRVVGLSTLAPVTVDALVDAMFTAFRAEYAAGGEAQVENTDTIDWPGYEALAARNATWEWNYGETPAFDASFSHRFDWGGVELLLRLAEGRVAGCKLYTDAMDPDLSVQIEAALLGCPFDARETRARVGGDMGTWLGSLETLG